MILRKKIHIIFLLLFSIDLCASEVELDGPLFAGSVEDVAFHLLGGEGINYWLLDPYWNEASKNRTTWKFTTEKHPSHPAVVKINHTKDFIYRVIGFRCESTKIECEYLNKEATEYVNKLTKEAASE